MSETPTSRETSVLMRPSGAGDLRTDTGRKQNVFAFIWSVSGRQQMVLVALAITVAALEVAPIELQQRIIDGAIRADSMVSLAILCAMYLGVIIVHGAVKHALRVYRNVVAEDVLRASRARLYKLSEEAPKQNAADDEQGTRVAVLGQEAEQISIFAGSAYSEATVQMATILGVVLYMALTEPMLALVSLPFLIPQLFAVPFIQNKINHLSGDRVERRRVLNDAVMEADTERFMDIGMRLRDLGVHIAWWKSIARVVVNGLNALAPLSVLAFGGWLVINGETSVGVMVAFISGFQRLADPVRDLVDFYRNASLTQTRYRLVGDWLCSMPNDTPRKEGR